ncbi:hypothetical protein LSPH24S_00094 [Lysinibacillus sphaericus]
MVMRSSIDSLWIASPVNSTICPVPTPIPNFEMIAKIISFAATPTGSSPSTRISIVFGLFCHNVCVDITCSTSDVPIPNAIAPNAPCVDVCESPQTIVLPGCVKPNSVQSRGQSLGQGDPYLPAQHRIQQHFSPVFQFDCVQLDH